MRKIAQTWGSVPPFWVRHTWNSWWPLCGGRVFVQLTSNKNHCTMPYNYSCTWNRGTPINVLINGKLWLFHPCKWSDMGPYLYLVFRGQESSLDIHLVRCLNQHDAPGIWSFKCSPLRISQQEGTDLIRRCQWFWTSIFALKFCVFGGSKDTYTIIYHTWRMDHPSFTDVSVVFLAHD